MTSTEDLPLNVPFFCVMGAVIFLVTMFWVPFRSGRRPLALVDQFSAIGISGALGFGTVGAEGTTLWVSGLLGLAGGLGSYLTGNRVLGVLGPPQSSSSAFGVIVLAFLGCGAAALLACWAGAWLVQHA